MSAFNFAIHCQPFSVAVNNSSRYLYDAIRQLYPANIFGPIDSNVVYDFDLTVKRRWAGLVGEYLVGSASEHFRMSEQAHLPAIFEWAFNWSVASFQHYYLAFHAAVVQKDNLTLILPAEPGSGKSTLSGILMLRGWRLLSDESCLLDIKTGMVVPCVRPVSLKNHSLSVIRQRYPEAPLKLQIENTIKGTVGYLLPSDASWQGYDSPCYASHVIFPQYSSTLTQTVFEPIAVEQGILRLIQNSFNYSVLGAEGFAALSGLVRRVKLMQLQYADTDEMLSLLEQLK